MANHSTRRRPVFGSAPAGQRVRFQEVVVFDDDGRRLVALPSVMDDTLEVREWAVAEYGPVVGPVPQSLLLPCETGWVLSGTGRGRTTVIVSQC